MELILVRHAQPAWADDHQRAVNDPGLTERGVRQARRVAARLGADKPIDGLLVSTARRSAETAAPVADAVGLEAESHPWLHEIRLPDHWDGIPAQEVGRYLRESRQRSRDEWWDGIGGAESFRDFHRRVTTGLDGFLASLGVHRDGDAAGHLWEVPDTSPRLVLVAHAGTNSVLLGHLLGLEPEPWEWERFASHHASVTVLRTTPIAKRHIWSLQAFSDVGHLDPQDVTW